MSEMEQAGPESTSGAAASAGALLRQAREASGLHIAALAVSLKVPVKKLEALEADRFDLLPDAVFVRALASSVCRTLKVDPAPVLEKLPQTAAPRLAHVTSGINAPFRAPSDGPGPSTWDQVSRPAVLAVLALLMGALVLIFLPDIREQVATGGGAPEAAVMPPQAAVPSTESPGAAMPAAQLAMSSASGATAPAATIAASVPAAPAIAASVALSPSVSLSTPTVASPTLVITPAAPVAAAAPASSVVAAAPAGGIVVFKAKVESWVEVTDARGTVSLRKTLLPGEAAGASGALPLSVVVGRADSTQVQVRGKPLDLAPLARDNVARFEVK